MPIRSSSRRAQALALALAIVVLPALAHTDDPDAIPGEPGGKFSLAAAVRSLSASAALPSQRLPGYLMLGDPGIDHRGTELEHGAAQLGYRFTRELGVELAVGAHGSDPIHVEAAWLQGRGTVDAVAWTLGVGRRNPSQGVLMTHAGHLDRFGLMPLAKQAVTNGDWIEDGAELGLAGHVDAVDWTLDLGVWAARTFPGSPGSPPAPALHLGAGGNMAGGDWTVDGFLAQFRPSERGSRISSATGGHTHTAPSCQENLNQVVCFSGRSHVGGLSVQWQGRDLPVALAGAVMWRQEDGNLESRNGLGQYTGRTRGDWVQGIWRWASQWELGGRLERLSATQTLIGAGASLLASEAGLDGYSPQRRATAMLGYTFGPWLGVHLEGGREAAGQQTARFVALRVLLQWEHGFEAPDR